MADRTFLQVTIAAVITRSTMQIKLSNEITIVQGSAKRLSTGCVNAAGKLRQK